MKPIDNKLVNDILSDPNAKDNIILRTEQDGNGEPTLKCYIYHEIDDESIAYLRVNDEILSMFSATKDEVLDLAYDNTLRFHSPVQACFIDGLIECSEFLFDLFSDEFEYKLFSHDLNPGVVITSKNHMNGAVCVFLPKVMKRIHSILGDFYISFTSVHECIIHPCPIVPDYMLPWFIDTIKHVNDTETRDEDILTYNLYKCTEINDVLQIVKVTVKEIDHE